MKRHARLGGVCILLVAVAYSVTWGLELHREALGFQDADNPATMIAFLREHPDVYTWSGIAFVAMAVALVVAVLSVWELAASESDTVLLRAAMVIGLFAAAFFFGQGVLRVQSPGTLIHMAGLGEESGRAAYLSVQMAGTQGFASAGGFALSIWAVAASLAALRRKTFPRLLVVLAVAPAAMLLLGLFGPLMGDALPGALYLVYVATIPGVILWCVALGVMLLRWAPREADPGAPAVNAAR